MKNQQAPWKTQQQNNEEDDGDDEQDPDKHERMRKYQADQAKRTAAPRGSASSNPAPSLGPQYGGTASVRGSSQGSTASGSWYQDKGQGKGGKTKDPIVAKLESDWMDWKKTSYDNCRHELLSKKAYSMQSRLKQLCQKVGHG